MVFITNPFWERGEIDMALRELKVCLLGVSYHRLLSERMLYVRSVWSLHCQMIPVASSEPYTSSIRLCLTAGRSVHINQTRLYLKSCYCVTHTGEFLMLPHHIMSVRVLCFVLLWVTYLRFIISACKRVIWHATHCFTFLYNVYVFVNLVLKYAYVLYLFCHCRTPALESRVLFGDLWRIALIQTSTQQLGKLLIMPRLYHFWDLCFLTFCDINFKALVSDL